MTSVKYVYDYVNPNQLEGCVPYVLCLYILNNDYLQESEKFITSFQSPKTKKPPFIYVTGKMT